MPGSRDKVAMQCSPMAAVLPFNLECCIIRALRAADPNKCRVGIPESDQFDQLLYDIFRESGLDLALTGKVPINIPGHIGSAKKFHVIAPGKQTHVIDLGDS